MEFEPIRDNVLIKPIHPDEKSPGGIILVGSSRRERARGVVVAVGPGRHEDGKLVPMGVKPRDMVLYSSYDEQKIVIEREEHYVVSEGDVVGIIRD